MGSWHNSQVRMMIAYFTLAVSIIAFTWIVFNLESILGTLGWMFTVMSPFIAGFVMAYILSIPANGMMRLLDKVDHPLMRRAQKAISVITVYMLFLFTIYITMRLLVPPIIDALVDLISDVPQHYQNFLRFLQELNESGQLPFYLNLDEIMIEMFGYPDIANLMGFITYDAVMNYMGTIVGGANALFRGFLTFISSIYFMFEGKHLARFLLRMLNAFASKRVCAFILDYGVKINQYFKKYIFCLLIDCVVMWVVGTAILMVLGSDYAILLGFLLGAMNLIPYFGSIIATFIAVIVVWLTQGVAMGAVSLVVLLISQQLDANVVQPRLYGTSLKLSPLLVIISVSVGGAIGGAVGGAMGGTVIGMIIAIPCAKVLMNIIDDAIDHREKRFGGVPEPYDTAHGRR